MSWESTDDLLKIIHRNMTFLKALKKTMDNAFLFDDFPWFALYPLFDYWYNIDFSNQSNINGAQLLNKVKYILTIRDSTWDLVNSRIKYIERNLLKQSNSLINTTINMKKYKQRSFSSLRYGAMNGII